MYWLCALTEDEDTAATSMTSPKIRRLLNLLMSFSISCHWLHDLFQKPGRFHAFVFGVQHMGVQPPGMGQLGRGVDAGQQVHASQQVRRIDGSVLYFFS